MQDHATAEVVAIERVERVLHVVGGLVRHVFDGVLHRVPCVGNVEAGRPRREHVGERQRLTQLVQTVDAGERRQQLVETDATACSSGEAARATSGVITATDTITTDATANSATMLNRPLRERAEAALVPIPHPYVPHPLALNRGR